jgi:hypothetical protein
MMTITMQGVESVSSAFDKLDTLIDDFKRKGQRSNPWFIMSPELAAFIEKLWRQRYLSPAGEICGKGVRRLIADMRNRTVRTGTAEVWDVLTDMVEENAQGMNANRIARKIRRSYRYPSALHKDAGR